jgi:hypothetical protein
VTTGSRWYKRRPYIHFDLPLGEKDATTYATDFQRGTRHAFYPFLTYKIVTPRIKKTPGAAKPFVKDPKQRTISYPAHKDGYIFSYYKSLLEAVYEPWLQAHSLVEAVTAFRATKDNNVILAKKAFDFIKLNPGCRIIATDVESFFDTIGHEILKKTWASFLGTSRLPDDHYAVYKAITCYSVVQRHKVYNLFGIPLFSRLSGAGDPKRLCTARQFRQTVVPRGLVTAHPGLGKGIGIPQGSSLSPLLSNMYMSNLDLAMYSWISTLGGAYWRYCDDILIVVPHGQPETILERLDQELKLLELKRSEGKTQTMNDKELASRRQLQSLGFIFNGSEAMVRSSSIHRYHRKLKAAIQAAEVRRGTESRDPLQKTPLRKQALYNRYSELPLRGRRAKARAGRQKYHGNFTHYMARAAGLLNSQHIERQRRHVLKKFRASIRKHK